MDSKADDSYYYGIFGDHMPDLNYDNSKVREDIINFAKFWLDKGIDGFSLDAAMHIYGDYENPSSSNMLDPNQANKNQEWWNDFKTKILKIKPDAYLVGEVWESPEFIAPYFKNIVTLFNFSVGENIINMVNYGMDIDVGENMGFASGMERSINRTDNNINKAKLAANIFLTLPGNPFIYYGEEIGMQVTKPDEKLREPFLWSKAENKQQTFWLPIQYNKNTVPVDEQQKDSNSMFRHYNKLIKLRQAV